MGKHGGKHHYMESASTSSTLSCASSTSAKEGSREIEDGCGGRELKRIKREATKG